MLRQACAVLIVIREIIRDVCLFQQRAELHEPKTSEHDKKQKGGQS